MNCIRVTACQPPVNLGMHSINFRNKYHCGSISSMLCVTPIHISRFPRISLKVASSISTYRQHTPVCLFGGKGKSENSNDDSSWKALEKAMGSVKKQPSIDESLKQQMVKQESYDDGDFDDGDIDDGGRIGRNRPGDGDGGGRGGDGDSGLYGEPDDKSYFAGLLEEAMQVIFAFVALLVWYQYFIYSEYINRDISDVIRYLLTKKKTEKLKRNLAKWQRFYKKLLVKLRRGYQKLLVKLRSGYQKLLVKLRRGYQKLQALLRKWLPTFIFNFGRKGRMLKSTKYITSITTKPKQNLEQEENIKRRNHGRKKKDIKQINHPRKKKDIMQRNHPRKKKDIKQRNHPRKKKDIKQRNHPRKKKDIKRAFAKLGRHCDVVYKKLRIMYELESSEEEDTEQDTIFEDEYTEQDMISKDEYTKEEDTKQEQEQDKISKDDESDDESTEEEQEQDKISKDDESDDESTEEEQDTISKDESSEEEDNKQKQEQDTISKDEYTEEEDTEEEDTKKEGGRISKKYSEPENWESRELWALPTERLGGITEQEGGRLGGIMEQEGGTYDEDTLRRIIEQGGGKSFDYMGSTISEEEEEEEGATSEEEYKKEDRRHRRR